MMRILKSPRVWLLAACAYAVMPAVVRADVMCAETWTSASIGHQPVLGMFDYDASTNHVLNDQTTMPGCAPGACGLFTSFANVLIIATPGLPFPSPLQATFSRTLFQPVLTP